MQGVLEQVQVLLKDRLVELDSERKSLDRALHELTGSPRSSPGTVKGGKGGRGPGRPPKAAGAPSRRQGGGTRAGAAIELVRQSPGVSASEIAKALKIKPNYLYRVLGGLEKEGRVRKEGRAYFPVS